jgi:hypothetical protein
MAEISDGTYVIVNAANTSLAMDSRGATDGNNSNVWLFTRNSSDAQFVRVWTRDDGTRQLCFPCTGKCVDVKNGSFTQGNNIQQYSANDSAAQQFTIDEVTDSTVTIDSTSYQLYKIHSASHTDMLVEYQGTGTPASGGNLCIAGDETSSKDQMWAFVPANPLPTGTYIIRPRVDQSLAVDVRGSSHAVGARCMISGEHVGSGIDNGNNQVVWLREYDDSGRAKIAFAHTLMLMEVPTTNTATSGSHICQCGDYGGTDQQWVLTPHGSGSYNGTRVSYYQLRNAAAQGTPLLLDVCGGGTTPGTWLQLYPQNSTTAQDFYFEPTAMVASGLATPSILGLSAVSSGSGAATSITANGATEVYAVWTGAGTTWKGRYRYRTRSIGHSVGSWSSWLSMADGSAANSGWGSEWLPNVTVSDTPRKVSPALAIPAVDNLTYDHVDVQVELRRYEADYQGHEGLCATGVGATKTISIGWKPTVSVTAIGWSPDGMIVSYESDYERGGNTARPTLVAEVGKTSSKQILSGGQAITGLPYEGTFTIPQEWLSDIVQDGETVTLGLTFTTDATSVDITKSGTVTWDASHDITIVPAYMVTDRDTLLVTIPSHTTDRVLLLANGVMEECALVKEQNGKKTFEAIPPLNSEYMICMSSVSGDEWGTNIDAMPAIEDECCIWNWTDAKGERRAAIVSVAVGTNPKMTDSRSADSTEIITTGRARPVYRFGEAQKRSIRVTGSLVHEGAGSRKWATYDDFTALMDAHHAVFRDYRGGRCTVAVTSIDLPGDGDQWTDVTVEQSEETL